MFRIIQRRSLLAFSAAFVTFAAYPATGFARTVMVGGAAMYPTRNIVQNAVNSKDHTTLVSAVKAAGLVDTLASPGPFTVFAPTNEAFAKLPAGAVQNLVMPENKAQLTKVLTYHVVAGNYSAQDLMHLVHEGHGQAMLKTVQGESLTIEAGRRGKGLYVIDAAGHQARITISNVGQSNGVIHVVNSVLMP